MITLVPRALFLNLNSKNSALALLIFEPHFSNTSHGRSRICLPPHLFSRLLKSHNPQTSFFINFPFVFYFRRPNAHRPVSCGSARRIRYNNNITVHARRRRRMLVDAKSLSKQPVFSVRCRAEWSLRRTVRLPSNELFCIFISTCCGARNTKTARSGTEFISTSDPWPRTNSCAFGYKLNLRPKLINVSLDSLS